MIILLSVTVFVCHDKGNVFLYNKFTSICILETRKNNNNNVFILVKMGEFYNFLWAIISVMSWINIYYFKLSLNVE